MSPAFKRNKEKPVRAKKGKPAPAATPGKRRMSHAGRERVLIEFPVKLLERTDHAAAHLEKSRSELIRTAVEQMLDRMEKKRFEMELAAAYAANANRNIELAEEFFHVDREGF